MVPLPVCTARRKDLQDWQGGIRIDIVWHQIPINEWGIRRI